MYKLHITYKSNEQPWSMTFVAHWNVDDDIKAIKWFGDMQKNLECDYIVTLYKDGRVMLVDDVATISDEMWNSLK